MDSLKWFVDPGHAWLRVPKTRVDALGIRDSISSYSYEDDKHLYLEQDCDALVFAEASYKEGKGGLSDIAYAEVVETSEDSFVRGLSHVG